MAGNWNLYLEALFVLCVFVLNTRGYPFDTDRSSDAYGRQFIVVLPIVADTNVRMVHNIYMSSRSSEIVKVNISRPGTTWKKSNINVQPGILANATLDMRGAFRIPFNPNGIPIQIEAGDDIGVWVVPGLGDVILGGYRAIPVEAMSKNAVAVLYPSLTYTSEIVVYSAANVSNEIYVYFEDATMGITIDNRTDPVQTVKGVPHIFDIPKTDSAKIVSQSDLSGMKLTASRPISVTSRRNCSTSAQACNDLMEQSVPLGTWGQSFVIVPQITNGPTVLKLRIICAFYLNTTIYTYGSSGVLQETWVMTKDDVFKDIDVSQGRLFTIRASKPIMVTQFFTDKQRRLDYAAMATLPPVEQFTNRTVVFPALNHHKFNNTLIVITRCEHRRDILLNNKDITNKYSYSVKFNKMQNSSVHGTYCVFNTTLLSGSSGAVSHTLKLRNNANIGAAYSAIVYGSGTKEAYAYQVAGDLQEIVCGVDSEHVSLCEFYVPPDYSPPSTNGTQPTQTEEGTDSPAGRKGPDHTIAIVIVLVILSCITLIIVAIVVMGSCGKNKGPRVAWRRLNTEMHYDPADDEDNVEVDL